MKLDIPVKVLDGRGGGLVIELWELCHFFKEDKLDGGDGPTEDSG